MDNLTVARTWTGFGCWTCLLICRVIVLHSGISGRIRWTIYISFKVGQLEPSSCGEICISPNDPITRPEHLKIMTAVDIETECKYAQDTTDGDGDWRHGPARIGLLQCFSYATNGRQGLTELVCLLCSQHETQSVSARRRRVHSFHYSL